MPQRTFCEFLELVTCVQPDDPYLDDDECFAGTKLCEGSVVASVSKSL
jgi:hypothetical protein